MSVKATTYEGTAGVFKLDPHTASMYVRFMKLRFPEEEFNCRRGYAGMWALRFQAGDEYREADEESKKVLKQLSFYAES